jgi:hypothetical protein
LPSEESYSDDLFDHSDFMIADHRTPISTGGTARRWS